MAELHVQKKRNRTWWVWLLVILIIAAVVYYYLVQNGTLPNPTGVTPSANAMLVMQPDVPIV